MPSPASMKGLGFKPSTLNPTKPSMEGPTTDLLAHGRGDVGHEGSVHLRPLGEDLAQGSGAGRQAGRQRSLTQQPSQPSQPPHAARPAAVAASLGAVLTATGVLGPRLACRMACGVGWSQTTSPPTAPSPREKLLLRRHQPRLPDGLRRRLEAGRLGMRHISPPALPTLLMALMVATTAAAS